MRLARSLALCLLLAVPGPLLAGDASAGRLTFVKTFKGSVPEFTRIVVEENGQATYQGGRAEEPSEPDSFRLSVPVTSRLFSLAGALNYFRGVKLEYTRPVAHLGEKVVVYEKGAERTEVRYNYTQNPTADELQRWFERIGRGRFLIQQLEFRARYDRLGVLETLRQFEQDFNTGELVELEQFVPILEQLAGDQRLMRLVQTRAQQLLGRIRRTSWRLQFEYGDLRSGWYAKVIVEEQGSARYEHRRFSDLPAERRLVLPAGTAARLGELLRQANYLRGQTMTGDADGKARGYRLIFEAGAEHNEAAFLQPPDAVLAEIVHLFRQLLEQEGFRTRLRAALEKESVTLQVVLQELEGAVFRNALADPREFVPVLEQIATNNQAHPLVRERAERLLARIRAGG